jgi:hypothetical protein
MSEGPKVGKTKGLCPLKATSFYENLANLYSEHNYEPQ